MKKQRPEVGMDSSIKTPKIPKHSRPTSSQYKHNQSPSLTQIRQSSSQPLSQLMNFTQIFDPTVRTDNLDQLTEIWNLAKENKITLSQDRDQIHVSELKASVDKAELKIERLQNSLYKQKELHKSLVKHIDEECKIQETIMERQNLVKNLRSVVQEHTVAITSGLDDCYKSQEFLTDLYNDVSIKQQKLIKSLKEKMKNNVSKKIEELEGELESKTHKLLILNTECDKTLEEKEEKTSLLNRINNELEESKAMIKNNSQNHNLETQHITKTIEEMKINDNTEREQNSKLLAERNEKLKLNDESLKMYKDLNDQDKGYLSQIEKLEFIELGLQSQEKKLDSEFDELTNNYHAITSDKELQIAEERMKEIQDLTSVRGEVANKVKKSVSTEEKLSKLLAEADEQSKKLEQISEIRGNEIVKMRTKLNDNLTENKILSASIETKNGKLMQIEKEINKKRGDLETLKAKQNGITQTEAELRAELSLTKQQLSDKCEESVEILKKESDERSKSSREVQNLEKEIQEKINLIAQEKKATLDLKKKTGNHRSELTKKIQDATRSFNKYLSGGNGKRFKDQNAEIKALKQTLEAEKQKQLKLKKTAAKENNTEKFGREKKKLNLTLDDLRNQLAAVKKQIEDLAKQVTKAETSNKAETESHMRSDVSTTPNSILKPVTRESLPRVSRTQKVHFDLGEIAVIDSDKNLGMDKIKSQNEVPSQKNKSDSKTQRPKTMEIHNGAERQYMLNPQTKKLQFVRTPAQNSQEENTSPGVAALQASQPIQERPASQPRKFFKLPRPDVKTMYKFVGK